MQTDNAKCQLDLWPWLVEMYTGPTTLENTGII